MNYGDFPIEETIHVFFTTRAFATGIPGTLSAATVAVYEDITATPIETSVAVTESLNSIAGLNAVPIVAIAASGYEVGKNYHVVIEAGTVDSVSVVGEVVAYFSIGRSAAAVDLANGTDGLGAIKTETAAILDDTDLIDDGTSGLVKIATDVAATLIDTAVIGALGAGLTNIPWNSSWDVEVQSEVDDALIAKGLDHLVFTSVTGTDIADNSIIAKMVDDAATADWDSYDNTTASLEALNVDTDAVKAETALIVADTGELQTDWVDAGRLDVILDARASQTTADAIETDTQDIQGRLPATLASGNMKSDVLAISGDTTAADNLEESATTIVVGAAEAGTLSTTEMTSDLAEATDDHYIGRTVIWVTGVLAGQASDITDYLGSTGKLTYSTVTDAPSATDVFVIV